MHVEQASAVSRRQLLAGAGAALLGGCATPARTRADRPRLAVTIDDFDPGERPLLSLSQRDSAVLEALARHRLRATGFPAGKHIDGADGRARLSAWSGAGHAIGCHSYAHAYYSGRDPAAFAADLDRALPLVDPYPTSVRLFRFPFLAEGRTAQARDAARAALAARGRANGHVTIDTSDWYVSRRLEERLRREPKADLAPYRDYYLAHLFDRAAFYDALARAVLGRGLLHTLLLHHNLACALFLGDALAMFRARGWGLIDAGEAFADPVYRALPDIVPAGQSLVWQLAKANGRFDDRLRLPGEDGAYEKAAMDRLGL